MTVTFSHHRTSASPSTGAERVRAAGVPGVVGVVWVGGGGGGVVAPGADGRAGGGVVPGAVPVPVPEPEPELVPAPAPVPRSPDVPDAPDGDAPGRGSEAVPGAGGDGDDVLEVVPLADADGAPSSGIRVTDPDGGTAPFGEEPAPTAA
ncbi:hypothetical protein [Streptomyces vilmorinianum]|uniref:hypothetical protein n=1 Tax=Streptomyces vilmorinianum TaxID=3051092 RepID=UPI0020C7A8A0|nr:hypothetical protein [Streptomyces vilmorinianum]